MSLAKYKAETFLNPDGSITGTASGFRVNVDHPGIRGLVDDLKGMAPVELFMNALASCQLLVIKSAAPGQGIDLLNAKMVVAAEVDNGSHDGYNGISKIEIHYYIQANNTAQQIAEFLKFAQEECTIHATIATLPHTELKYVIHVVK